VTPLLDGRRQYSRPNNRFLIFALAAILAIGGLTTRLFYLQIVNGGQFTVLSEGNRTSAEAIPSARGLIYDRRGVALVKNVPTFAVKIRPVDLPEDRRDDGNGGQRRGQRGGQPLADRTREKRETPRNGIAEIEETAGRGRRKQKPDVTDR